MREKKGLKQHRERKERERGREGNMTKEREDARGKNKEKVFRGLKLYQSN